MTTYASLRRDLDIQKAMYQEISRRLTETSITTALENNNVTFVEKPLADAQGLEIPAPWLDLQPRLWRRPRVVGRRAR